jgi:hypothetical protein
MIYDKLDYKPLVDEYVKAVKSGHELRKSHGPREMFGRVYTEYTHGEIDGLDVEVLLGSISVVRHVLQLWDAKLNKENPQEDNLIEREITPAILVYRYDLDLAGEFGGSVYERYLLRQYQWHSQVEGIELGYENVESKGDLQLNKWLYHLVQMDTAGGKEFRKNNAYATKKIAEVIVNSRFNNEKAVPEFIFYDLEAGKNCLAYQFWPEYTLAVEDSFPGWENDKLKKRFTYLANLGELATFEMYMDCWRKIDKVDDLVSHPSLSDAVKIIPGDMQAKVGKAILKNLEKRRDVKHKKVPEGWHRPMLSEDRHIGDLTKFLAEKELD